MKTMFMVQSYFYFTLAAFSRYGFKINDLMVLLLKYLNKNFLENLTF